MGFGAVGDVVDEESAVTAVRKLHGDDPVASRASTIDVAVEIARSVAGVRGRSERSAMVAVLGRADEHNGGMALPATDGVITLRSLATGDRDLLLAGRDRESERWLGPGSLDPIPTAGIEVGGVLVGWIDADASAAWLLPGEVNMGYFVLGVHRGRGYATRAARLLAAELDQPEVTVALLVIHADNVASHHVARKAGARILTGQPIAQFSSSMIYALGIGTSMAE